MQAFLHSIRRRPEPYLGQGPFQEHWNTVSNVPFLVIGLLRLWSPLGQEKTLRQLYVFYVLAGVCSGIHHAIDFPGSIVLDWMPISYSLLLWYRYDVVFYLSAATWAQLGLALGILLVDHLGPVVPVPWGHVLWHITAALAVDAAYQDYHLAGFDW